MKVAGEEAGKGKLGERRNWARETGLRIEEQD
jgi:hypothetical protein